MIDGKMWLLGAGWLSLTASALHLVCIVGGPSWYRALGAGEGFARAAEQGSWVPPLATFGIASVLAIWASYAFSAGGMIGRLPFTRTALVLITGALALRGLAVLAPDRWRPDLSYNFKLWSSMAVLLLAACFAMGTKLAWATLSMKDSLQ
jgi:hypothetical protein